MFAQAVDLLASRVWRERERLSSPRNADDPKEPHQVRWRRRALVSLSGRLLHDGPTTWDRTWKQIRRSQPYVYARIITKSGREIVGLAAETSRVAVSPQPHDLYIEQVLRERDDGKFYPTAYGLGAFIAGDEIESVEWVSYKGVVRQ